MLQKKINKFKEKIRILKDTIKAMKKVLKKYPSARISTGGRDTYSVSIYKTLGVTKVLGTGWTEEEAWIEAAFYLKKHK